MSIDNWINLVAAIILLVAVIVSLVLGIRSLRQTRDIQQRQEELAKRIQQREDIEKLVAHIREWAIDVITENFGGELSIMPGVSKTVHKQQDAVNRLLKCQVLSVKGKAFVEPIASSLSEELGDENFSNDVKSIVGVLEAIMGKIRERGKDVDNEEVNKQLEQLDGTLATLTNAVIRQTVEYTTRQLDSS